jgi:undecaprenyl-phosphate 4-deoxy-4-formamido-L-arabinose transferase
MKVDLMARRCDVSVVIPVYRSSATLRNLADRLAAVLEAERLSWELILVDDGSPDDSWKEMVALHRQRPDRIVAVQLTRNFGQHNALMCGLRRARGETIVSMDDDLQNPPEELPKLLAALREQQLDLVYGFSAERHHRGWRNSGSWLMTTLFRWLFGVGAGFTSFRAMRQDLVRSVLTYDLNFTFLDGLMAWNTNRIGAVRVRHEARAQGKTGYSPAKLLLLSLNLLTNFSLVPLQVATWLGLLAAVGGLALGSYYLFAALSAQIVVPGYASIIIAVLMLGGIQLLALGIIGEYLGRVHLNINRKPQFVERQALGPEEAEAGWNDAIGEGPGQSA